MTDMILSLFSYSFIVRALVAGSLVALCSALLGVTLVLKRYSMIGDGLSHVGFGTLAVAMALNLSPLAVSVPVSVLAAFLLLRISSSEGGINGDAAIALISASSLALGILLALSKTDVLISVVLSAVVIVLFVCCYRNIFLVTFDSTFATAAGINSAAYDRLIAVLTALTVVVGMRLMGSMMISSLIIFPALTSMRVFRSFFSVTVCSSVLSVVCFFTGIMISFVFSLPAGASIVTVNLAAFIIFWLAGKILKK